MTRAYLVHYRDSKNQAHVAHVQNVDSADAAREQVMASAVTVEGMGGKYVTVVEVLNTERVA